MKVRIMDQPVTISERPDAGATPIAQVAVGQVVEVGGLTINQGRKWVEAALPDARHGYMPADASVLPLRRVVLGQNDVNAYAQPTPSAPVVGRYGRSTKLHLGEVVESRGKRWVTVLDSQGNEGFIDGQTRYKAVAETTKSLGRKNMLVGAVWCVIGIVVAVGSIALSGGGTFVIASGAIVIGIIRFFQGFAQFVKAPI